MDVAVIIPAKGHSQRIPRKNLVDWRGKPLILWSIEYAHAEGFEPMVVTDDSEIESYARRCGADVIVEPNDVCALNNFQVAQWVAKRIGRHIVTLQTTSPVRRPGLLRGAIDKLATCDSVYGGARPPADLLHDRHGRCLNRKLNPDGSTPFSQELVNDPQWLRTGAIFAVRSPDLLEHNDWLFGRVGVLEVDWQDVIDIDEPEDLQRPKVVVVGNASNLSHRRIGWLIDEHDVVVRVNLYETHGYESQVGSKTTHWTLVASPRCAQLLRTDRRDLQDCSNLVEVWVRRTNPEVSGQLLSGILHSVKRSQSLMEGHAPQRELQQLSGDRHTPATTGLMAIAEALRRWGPPIDIAGFGPADRVHRGYYFRPDAALPVESQHHDCEAERRLINSWEKAGLVRRIDQ